MLPSPDINNRPLPDDVLVLRGDLQMETALLALAEVGINPELQDDLVSVLNDSAEKVRCGLADGRGEESFSETFCLTGETAKEAKKDIIRGLEYAKNKKDLAVAATCLLEILDAK